MILFDIQAIPDGMDIYTWFDLLKQGYALYDGTHGTKPLVIDGEIGLYDVNTLSDTETVKIKNLIDDIIARRNKILEDDVKLIAENNKKLIEYMREINKS